MNNADFSCFSDGSYLKGNNCKYCAGYALLIFLMLKAASLSMPTAAQQAEFYAVTQAWTLVKDKTANNYSDSKYVY